MTCTHQFKTHVITANTANITDHGPDVTGFLIHDLDETGEPTRYSLTFTAERDDLGIITGYDRTDPVVIIDLDALASGEFLGHPETSNIDHWIPMLARGELEARYQEFHQIEGHYRDLSHRRREEGEVFLAENCVLSADLNHVQATHADTMRRYLNGELSYEDARESQAGVRACVDEYAETMAARLKAHHGAHD